MVPISKLYEPVKDDEEILGNKSIIDRIRINNRIDFEYFTNIYEY